MRFVPDDLMASMVGRTIVRAEWEDEDEDGQGDTTAVLWLDDGRVVQFSGWGHDWWGTNADEIEVVDVESCRHCGKPHSDLMWFPNVGPGGMAYCTDGYHSAVRVTAAEATGSHP